MDSLSQTVDYNKAAQEMKDQQWSYSYPVYIEHADDDSLKNFAFTVSDNITDSSFATPGIIYMNSSKNSQSINNSYHTAQRQTIKVTKTEDGKSINIVIDIL